LKRIPRIYDAHELFTELKEVVTRPSIHRKWLRIEKHTVPKFRFGYTVSEGIAEEFKKRYGVEYSVIRNLPVLRSFNAGHTKGNYILYQGAVNEARAFEYLVPAMQKVKSKLVVCGDGNFMPQLKKLIQEYGLEEKIELKGKLTPDALWQVSISSSIGIAIAEKQGLNQYLALPNKFFDYMHAGLPQVTMNFPEYQKINSRFEVAVLVDDLAPERIALAINNLLDDDVLYMRMRENCLKARLVLNWQEEEKKLVAFYQHIFKK
jgi:glycosyltransferase involved in cell wall biosynthesis